MYTCNGAFALFKEKEIGTLTPGENADLVIWIEIWRVPKAEKIKDTNVV